MTRRRTHADETLSGFGLFLVVVAAVIGAWLLWPEAGADPASPFAGGLDVELRADLAAARSAGQADPTESDADLLQQSCDAIVLRLTAAGVEPVRAKPKGADRILVTLPGSVEALTDKVRAAMTGTPSGQAGGPAGLRAVDQAIALRLVVEPAENRGSPWAGNARAFNEWKLGEVLRYQQGQIDAGVYTPTPSKHRLAVAPRAGTEGTQAWDFVVLQQVGAPIEQFFGSGMLTDASLETGRDGQDTVAFGIRPRYRGAFEAFTAGHRGRRLAILLRGQVVATPRIPGPISETLRVTLDSRMHAEALARNAPGGAQAGPLRVRCYYVGEQRRP